MNRIIAASVIAAGLSWTVAAQGQTEILTAEGRFGAGSPNEHRFDVEAGQTIEVIARGIGVGADTTLNATLPNGESLYNDDYDGLDAGFVRTFATGGTVSVEVSPLSGSAAEGGYRLIVRALPPAATMAIGDTVQGRLIGGTGDRYQVVGQSGDRVVIDLKSYDFDAFLTLTDSAGNEYTDDDGGDEGYNSRLQYSFREAGTVTITAGSLGSADGRYTLAVEPLSTENVVRHEGALTPDDPRAYDGQLYDAYEIEGQAGDTVSIALESDDFDTVVYIANPDGTNLGRNDDGTDGTNSELIVRLFETGAHTIYVTALSDATGDYVLTIYQ
ncbi:hypothetical protein HFP89_08375 [Wenzhouxiangella sp. XN79A]|uniref:hypothetical protein n=1 Tax=Wenzhouxiangella sp. XN79A TaxID=2724193 RepID=UPI00144AA2F6|nr:hypothetical protein [Wenzhouxiangella sp. XN79A]NKI35180.1 hypothetical protein [Wenzhouxiangella sp. XN79A]